jgi:hypothetical protein
MQRIVVSFPTTQRIVLVQGNLNTRHASPFHENLPPAEAFRLSQRFEMRYMPKKGSWLNMA